MIEKYCHIPAYDPVNGQNVFVLDSGLEKTASIVKEAQVSPEVAQAIDKISHEPGHRYVLVNGIGAGEFWSSNRNGDYFPESGLKHAGDDYGHQTFMAGHNFLHHENKDPMKAVGAIKFATYNPRMHRCELILDTDLNKLSKADPAVYEKVANGEPVDVSMGSKCDFDVCSICSNRAANRSEYCSHLKTAMNQVLDDGRKVYAYTPHPRFFDMSYVTKGADVTAKALQYLNKSASVFCHTRPGAEKIASSPCPDPSMHEAVSCEEGFTVPEFPDDHKAARDLLEVTEPTIASEVLDAMAKVGFNESLSTCSNLGIILKPEEYQRLTLVALGHSEVADRMEKAGAVIDPTEHSIFDPEIKTVAAQTAPGLNAKVASLVMDYIPERSIFEPYFSGRLKSAVVMPKQSVAKLAVEACKEKTAGTFLTPEMAAALALGYIVYRKGVPTSDIDAVRKAIHDPKMSRKVLTVLIPLIAAGSVIDKMIDFEPPTASAKNQLAKAGGIGTEVLLPVGGTYLMSAYARRKAERGRRISGIEHMFLEYPLPIAIGGVAGIQALKGRFKRTLPKQSGIISPVMEKKAIGGMALALGSGIYRPRLSGAIGYSIDELLLTSIGAGLGGAKKLVSSEPAVK